MNCRRCGGTGIEPPATITDRWGSRWLLHEYRKCPICGAPLMLGHPAGSEWHCSALKDKDPNWMEHYAKSRLIEKTMAKRQ